MGDAIDRALDQLGAGATMVGLVLPALPLEADQVDEGVSQAAAAVIQRMLSRGITWEGRSLLTEGDVGYVDTHVASNAATERRLRQLGIGPATKTTTPEIWQGLQRPIMVVKHPLSGASHFGAFDLDPGRLCVMTSRHQLGCVMVSREGVAQALERHAHDCSDRPTGAEDVQWVGWRANNSFWSMLEQKERLERL
jgi:hypothetical protein